MAGEQDREPLSVCSSAGTGHHPSLCHGGAACVTGPNFAILQFDLCFLLISS